MQGQHRMWSYPSIHKRSEADTQDQDQEAIPNPDAVRDALRTPERVDWLDSVALGSGVSLPPHDPGFDWLSGRQYLTISDLGEDDGGKEIDGKAAHDGKVIGGKCAYLHACKLRQRCIDERVEFIDMTLAAWPWPTMLRYIKPVDRRLIVGPGVSKCYFVLATR